MAKQVGHLQQIGRQQSSNVLYNLFSPDHLKWFRNTQHVPGVCVLLRGVDSPTLVLYSVLQQPMEVGNYRPSNGNRNQHPPVAVYNAADHCVFRVRWPSNTVNRQRNGNLVVPITQHGSIVNGLVRRVLLPRLDCILREIFVCIRGS